jgi:hypothetical protein
MTVGVARWMTKAIAGEDSTSTSTFRHLTHVAGAKSPSQQQAGTESQKLSRCNVLDLYQLIIMSSRQGTSVSRYTM